MGSQNLNLKNRVFLLTGGTGYIGSVTAKEILKSSNIRPNSIFDV